jgi:uncharacterized protein YndB with AHSA1/START domain
MDNDQLDDREADREIILIHVFNAPIETVWQAWTKRAQVAKWWGPAGFTNRVVEMKVRPGGVWKNIMRAPDGTEHINEMVYDDVAEPYRLVFTYAETKELDLKPFQSTVDFYAVGKESQDMTEVVWKALFASKAEKERHVKEVGAIEGGNQTLARLADFLENNK